MKGIILLVLSGIGALTVGMKIGEILQIGRAHV